MNQPRPINRYLVWTALAVVSLPIAAMAIVSKWNDIPMETLTKDIAALVQVHPLAGTLSNLGVLLWWTSASVWLFSSLLHLAADSRGNLGFKLSSAAFSMYLGLDDFFLIHESLAPRFLHLPELGVISAIGIGAVAYLWLFRRAILRPDGLWLAASFAFLAMSASLDAVVEPWMQGFADRGVLLEDGSKWAGIVCWCAYSFSRCLTDGLALLSKRENSKHTAQA